MDWDRVQREERAARQGTERASGDFDDLTPEERRERRRPVPAKAQKIVEQAKAEMDSLVRRCMRLEIADRDRRYDFFQSALVEVRRIAINQLPRDTPSAAFTDIREHLALAQKPPG
jgi:hypothetical protein